MKRNVINELDTFLLFYVIEVCTKSQICYTLLLVHLLVDGIYKKNPILLVDSVRVGISAVSVILPPRRNVLEL